MNVHRRISEIMHRYQDSPTATLAINDMSEMFATFVDQLLKLDQSKKKP
jgi:hypothetical protein